MIPTIENYIFNSAEPQILTSSEVADALSSVNFTHAMKNCSTLRSEWEETSGNCIQPIAYVRATARTIGIRPTFIKEVWSYISQNPKKLTQWKFITSTFGSSNEAIVRFTSPYGMIVTWENSFASVFYVVVEINIKLRSIAQTLKNYLGIRNSCDKNVDK